MVAVLIEEMFGSDCNRPLDYERAVVVNVQQKQKKKDERKNSFRKKGEACSKSV
jgi:hypothetical protein